MKCFRVTFEGYQEHVCETEEEAIQKFIEFIKEEQIDCYGRTWENHIVAEDLGEFEDDE